MAGIDPGVLNAIYRKYQLQNPSLGMNPMLSGENHVDSNTNVPPQNTPAPAVGATPAGSTSVNDYDYDPTYDQSLRQIVAARNAANSQFAQGTQQVNTQFQAPAMQLQNQYSDSLQQQTGQMADRGILRSSNNLYGQGKLNDAFQQSFGNLVQQRQQAFEGLDRTRATTMQDLLNQQMGAEGAHATFVGEKEKQRAMDESNLKAIQDALAAQNALKQKQVDATNQARQAYQQATTPQVTTTPTGQIIQAPPTNDMASAPTPWNGAPQGWYNDINKKLWW